MQPAIESFFRTWSCALLYTELARSNRSNLAGRTSGEMSQNPARRHGAWSEYDIRVKRLWLFQQAIKSAFTQNLDKKSPVKLTFVDAGEDYLSPITASASGDPQLYQPRLPSTEWDKWVYSWLAPFLVRCSVTAGRVPDCTENIHIFLSDDIYTPTHINIYIN